MTKSLTLAALLLGTAAPAFADGELNLYSSRHYDTDERLYSDFEDATGITINRIEGNADELSARMAAEGINSPADILITVDTSRLERAKDMGLLQSIDSDVLEAAVPANLQDTENQWFGFSQRARVIFYDKADVTNPPMTYLDLADPAYPFVHEHVQPNFAGIDHRKPRRRRGPHMGARGCRQHGARSTGWRYRSVTRYRVG